MGAIAEFSTGMAKNCQKSNVSIPSAARSHPEAMPIRFGVIECIDAVEKPLTKNRTCDEQNSASQNTLYSTIVDWGRVK